MNIKRASLLFVSLVLLLALFAHSSLASSHENSQSLAGAFDTIKQLFGFLPELITMEKLLGGDTASLFWAKFLVWLALFAVFYFGTSMVFKDRNHIAIVVALSFSLIGALLIPKSMLINALQTYGLVAGLLFWLVPLIAGFFIANMTKNHWLKAIIYGTAAWVLWSINETVVKEAGFINTSFPYFSLLFAATVIAFFWNLLGIGWGTAGQSGAGGWAGDKLGGPWDKVNQPSERGIFGGGGGNFEERRGARKAKELAKTEDDLIKSIGKIEIESLNSDIKIKNFLESVRNALHSKYFGDNRIKILGKFSSLNQAIPSLVSKDKEVWDTLEKTSKLVEIIVAYLKDTTADSKKNFEKALTTAKLKAPLKNALVVKTDKELFEKLRNEAGTADKIKGIEDYLRDSIKGSIKKREKLFGELKTELNSVVTELSKEKPDIEKLESALAKAIEKIDAIIALDRSIIDKAKEMYKENKFLETILAGDTGGTVP